MTELLNNIKGLLDEAIEYDHNLMNTYTRLTRTYDGLERKLERKLGS